MWWVLALALACGLPAQFGCRAAFVKMPRSGPDSPYRVHPSAVGAYIQGMRARGQGDWPRARECFAAAHELDPHSPRVLVRLAVSTCEAGMADEARPLLKRAEEAAAEDPELAIIMARFRARRGDMEGAARYYGIAAGSEDLLFTATWEQAWLFEKAGDFEAAELEYGVLAEKGGRPVGHAILGGFYLRRRRHDEALEQFGKVAHALNHVCGDIAVCLAELGDLDGAIASLGEYEAFDYTEWPRYEVPEAMQVYEAGDPPRGGLPWGACLRVAGIAMSEGRPNKALDALQAALDCGGETPEILETMGDAYRVMDRNDRAREAWNKALELKPDRAAEQRIRGKIGSLSD